MAKLTVVTDQGGNIVATFQSVKASKDAPGFVRIRPQEGQHAYELEVADKLAAADSVHQLHSTHRVEMKAGVATLVENRG